MNVEDVLPRLEGVIGRAPQWHARCPAHDDRNASLSISVGDDGRVLLTCWAGCDLAAIVHAIGLGVRDLFPANGSRPPTSFAQAASSVALPTERELAKYAERLQRDERMLAEAWEAKGWRHGTLAALGIGLVADRLTIPVYGLDETLVQFLRYSPDGSRKPKMLAEKGHPRTPLVLIVDDTNAIWLVEGEADAISLAHVGLNVIGVPGVGARARAEWLDAARGRALIVCMDNDDAGRDAVRRWAPVAHEVGSEARVVEWVDKPDKYDVGDLVREHRDDPGRARELLLALGAEARPIEPTERVQATENDDVVEADMPRQLLLGDSVLDLPDEIPAVWGDGQIVAWAEGETMMLCGDPGLGKTTLAQRLTLACCGLGDGTVLGLPVADDGRRVLYIAADRPAQALRSLARMVSDADRAVLRERLLIWRGAPPVDVVADPASLRDWVLGLDDVGTMIMDSLKDMAAGLTKDEVGSGVDRAFRLLCDAAVRAASLHHLRKLTGDASRTSKRVLDDVYGSRHLTGGAGSVLLLSGEPGGVTVELSTLKPIADPVGPLSVTIVHDTGVMIASARPDPLAVLVGAGSSGVNAAELAKELGYPDDRAGKARARRDGDRLVRDGLADVETGTRMIATRWFVTDEGRAALDRAETGP